MFQKDGVRDCVSNQSPSATDALSQLVSLTSSQMEELENSPDYDDSENSFRDESVVPQRVVLSDDREGCVTECGGDFKRTSTMKGHTLEQHSLEMRSTETGQRRKGSSQYQTGNMVSSRKRPHPDS